MKNLLLIIIIFSINIFPGCGSKNNNNVVELEFSYYQVERDFAVIQREFNKHYPNIHFVNKNVPNDLDASRARFEAGDAPDIIQLQSYSKVFEFASKNWLTDISNENFLDNIEKSSLNAVTYKGKVYAVPTETAGIGLLYNKKIFSKLGIKPPSTFSELKTVCTILKSNGITPFSIMLKDAWHMGHFFTMIHTSLIGSNLNSWLDSMNSGKGTFTGSVDDDRLFMVLDFYKANAGSAAGNTTYSDQINNFAGEKYGMMVQGLWAYGAALEKNPDLDAGFIPFPCSDNPDENRIYADTDASFAIPVTGNAEKTAAAKLFLEFITSKKCGEIYVNDYRLVTTVKGVDTSKMPLPYRELSGYVSAGKSNPWAFAMYPVDVFDIGTKLGTQEYMFAQRSRANLYAYLDDLWRNSLK